MTTYRVTLDDKRRCSPTMFSVELEAMTPVQAVRQAEDTYHPARALTVDEEQADACVHTWKVRQ